MAKRRTLLEGNAEKRSLIDRPVSSTPVKPLACRVSDGVMIANYRVPSDLSSLESTTDGSSVVLGMVDGNLTVLTIADPKKPHMRQYLKRLPSRNPDGMPPNEDEVAVSPAKGKSKKDEASKQDKKEE